MTDEQGMLPKITWHEHPNGHHTVRVEYENGKKFVHTSGDRNRLQKIIKDRYSKPAKFVM